MIRFLLVVAVLICSPVVLGAQSIQGVWRLTGGETIGGPNEETTEYQGGLLVYTENHFVWALDINEEPRPTRSDMPSDAEIAASLQGFTAQAGTYELDGSTLRYTTTTAANPNAALSENQPVERNLVSLTTDRLETSATNADGVTTILRYERID